MANHTCLIKSRKCGFHSCEKITTTKTLKVYHDQTLYTDATQYSNAMASDTINECVKVSFVAGNKRQIFPAIIRISTHLFLVYDVIIVVIFSHTWTPHMDNNNTDTYFINYLAWTASSNRPQCQDTSVLLSRTPKLNWKLLASSCVLTDAAATFRSVCVCLKLTSIDVYHEWIIMMKCNCTVHSQFFAGQNPQFGKSSSILFVNKLRFSFKISMFEKLGCCLYRERRVWIIENAQ